MRIIALDPGGTTGWAYVNIDENSEPEFVCGMFTAKNHHEELYNCLKHWQVFNSVLYSNIIVSESFEYRNASRPGLDLSSVEYIGVMKLFCQQERVPYFFQSASQGKIRDKPNAFIKPDNLKKLGLWVPGKVHAMDAYGHLLYFMIHQLPKIKEGHEDLRLKLLARGWSN